MPNFFYFLICILYILLISINNSKNNHITNIKSLHYFYINIDTIEQLYKNINLYDTTNNIDIEDYLKKYKGTASYYAHKFHRKKTASGERYDMYDYTAAHKKIPFGTIAKIINHKNNKSVLVKINDRGPFKTKRILDLSYRAAKDINGLNTPKIDLIYFDFEKLIQKFDTNYLAAHSINEEFAIFHKSKIKILDSIYTSNFEEVLTSYSQYRHFPNYECYILTKIEKPKNKTTFYIGTTINK